ncbi:TIR domain-containing protein [Cupriavidus consociatus]|uniref:TIR domain-containing protein n=1 Tax=Cupriavidus consociatus TaxID=2821357 RepID=UPI001AEA3B6E|nr:MULTISPECIES: TIR domain-containing protein [unclassified Cupriavidus]MBP0622874.1 TIR domain-containing protein [Cupriavidus sp. LEh25]MDK2659561.1 TIR domain-containing protein [Cupriavidus sp. LEh21]
MNNIKRKVFYSFHFDNDVFRVQQIRNMGVIEGDEPVQPNTWEEIKRKPSGVERWIDDNLQGKSCLIVLVGSETANRPWVKYEIKRAWELSKAIFGINIHNLKCPKAGTCSKGRNPFDGITFKKANGQIYVPTVYEPSSTDAYNDIKQKISGWIEAAIKGAA